jgi:hypothetical protein
MTGGIIRAGGIAGSVSVGRIESVLALGNSVIADAVNITVSSVRTYAGRIASGTVTGTDLYALRSMALSADITTGEAGADAPDVMDESFYESIGWDFTNIWFMPEDGGYPQLQGVKP